MFKNDETIVYVTAIGKELFSFTSASFCRLL